MNTNISIIGKTDNEEITITSSKVIFSIDEYYAIDDIYNGIIIAETIKAWIEIDENDEEQHYAILRPTEEIQSPISPNAKVRVPNFDEIKSLLVNTSQDKGLTLGVIRGTDMMKDMLPSNLGSIAPLFDSESKSIISQSGVPFILDHYKFSEYPHIGLFGGSGSGKTFGLRVICEEIMKKSISGIVLDPHNELSFDRDLVSRQKISKYDNKYEVLKVGQDIGIDFSELSTGELISLIQYIGNLSQPMVGAITELHERNDSFITLQKRVNDLRIAFENNEKQERDREELPHDMNILFAKYRNKISGAMTLQAISWRLEQLNATKIFSKNTAKVEKALQNRKLAVIRGSKKHLKMISSYLISKMYRKRRIYKDSLQYGDSCSDVEKFPPFFIVIDEAHEFAGLNDNTPIKQILVEISQEARKYGVFEIFGTQRPALLDTTIVAQLNTKIIFRTSIVSDMEMIKQETNLTEGQAKRLPSLRSGTAFISSATLRKTMYCQFRATDTASPHSVSPFDELDGFNSNDKLKNVIFSKIPFRSDEIVAFHSDINNEMQKNISIGEINSAIQDLIAEDMIVEEKSFMGSSYKKTK